MDWHFKLKQWIKHLNDGFVYYKPTAFCFTRLLESFELLVDYCDVFISCLDILMAPIHCRRSSDLMLHFSKSVNPMKKQIHLHLEWPKGEYIFSKLSFLGELFLWFGMKTFDCLVFLMWDWCHKNFCGKSCCSLVKCCVADSWVFPFCSALTMWKNKFSMFLKTNATSDLTTNYLRYTL